MKYILVTGGVISGIGKGVVTSSIGALLKAFNFRVTAIKIDPYINIDAGTFSPFEHGEVFVLNDGCEVDLDLGNYERFLNVDLSNLNNITTGKIYDQVINRERQGDYLGKTVQVIPHITDAIQSWIEKAAHMESSDGKHAEICLIELGGTVGDIESMPFIEALRQLQRRVKRHNFCCCHVNLVPCIGPSRELKSKPTQTSVRTLRSAGLYPDMIVCRSEIPITDSIKDKISNFCDVEIDAIFNLPDLKTIYSVPLELESQGMSQKLSECLQIDTRTSRADLLRWSLLSEVAIGSKEEIIIALVGKYTSLGDCYASVVKSLEHACFDVGARPKVLYIDSEQLQETGSQAWLDLRSSHCLLVPGGFGIRGVEGMIKAIEYARANNVPFLGVCLGFQMAAVEFARHVIGIKNAHSEEFDSDLKGSYEPVVIEMLDYRDPGRKMGASMRLGLKKTVIVENNTILRRQYGNVDVIQERHRHRYEINPSYISVFEEAGLKFVGKSEDLTRMEILELDESKHKYFVAVQFHPEYLSRPFNPSPPYKGLIEAARDNKEH